MAGALLGPVAQVRSSPLRRALDTAKALGATSNLTVDGRWVEVDYGELEGQPLAEIPAEVWHRWRTDLSFRPEGGESLGDVGQRVGEACTELFATAGAGARAGDGDVVVVSHVSPIKAAVGWTLGIDATVASRLHLSTGSITRIGWGSFGPLLYGYNEVPSGS